MLTQYSIWIGVKEVILLLGFWGFFCLGKKFSQLTLESGGLVFVEDTLLSGSINQGARLFYKQAGLRFSSFSDCYFQLAYSNLIHCLFSF